VGKKNEPFKLQKTKGRGFVNLSFNEVEISTWNKNWFQTFLCLMLIDVSVISSDHLFQLFAYQAFFPTCLA